MASTARLFLVLYFFVVVVRAEVGNNFDNCDVFFYKGSPPVLQRDLPQPPKRICQKYQNQYRFATLYSTNLRIPLFSAYKLPGACQGRQPQRRANWFVEPMLTRDLVMQLRSARLNGNMDTPRNANAMKETQAIDREYKNTGYDRGHLNPNFYQCDEDRTATFTLTNAVPQDPCFNQQCWHEMEEESLRTRRLNCSFPGAQRYFVTGVVKSRTRIPNEEHDRESDRNRTFNRVSVPSHMWTAVCCHDTINQGQNSRGFSFAYIGKNKPDSIVEVLPVSHLDIKLVSDDLRQDRYQIFVDDCRESSEKSRQIRAQVSVPMNMRVANALDDLSRVDQSTIPKKKRKLVHTAVDLIKTNKVLAYDYSFARLDLGLTLPRNNDLIKNTREILGGHAALVLTATSISRSQHDELDATTKRQRKNTTISRRKSPYPHPLHNGTHDQTSTPTEDDYLIVAGFSEDDPCEFTIQGDRCREPSYRFDKNNRRWCYTDWSDNQDGCCVSECKFRDGKKYQTCFTGVTGYDHYHGYYYSEEKECSSRFSAIAVSGKRCLADHECGLHGESYYWCYTDLNKNWDYCCRPWQACGKYGSSYKWCYYNKNDDIKGQNWAKCHY